jgi:hypothetical protein
VTLIHEKPGLQLLKVPKMECPQTFSGIEQVLTEKKAFILP